MIRSILPYLRRGSSSVDFGLTLGGRILQIGLAFAGNVLSARILGPADFGRFGLVIAVVMIAGTLADAGLTFAAIRSIAKYRDDDPGIARAVGLSYFGLRGLSALVLTALGILAAAPVASGLLGQPALEPYLALGILSLPALWLSSYPGAVLSGLSKFPKLAVAGLFNAAITIGGILLLASAGALNLGTLVAWNVILPVVSSIPAWLLLPVRWHPWRLRVGLDSAARAANDLVRFGKWTAAATVGAIAAGQIDLLLMGRLADPSSTGAYSVAVTLAGRLDVVNQSLFTVLMPKASRLTTQGDRRDYTRRVARGASILGAGLALLALAAQPFILLFYGHEYEASVPVFLILLPVVLIDMVTTSAMLVTFSTNQTRLMAMGEWLRAGTVAVAALAFIPTLGAVGAASARLLSRVTGGLYTAWALRNRVLVGQEAARSPKKESQYGGPDQSGMA